MHCGMVGVFTDTGDRRFYLETPHRCPDLFIFLIDCFIYFSPQRALLSVVWILLTVNQDHGVTNAGVQLRAPSLLQKSLDSTSGNPCLP
ncbi:UNVERIFIED_CONTAM: hypothetical protein FKN15_069333 [Acipenser sinensis]